MDAALLNAIPENLQIIFATGYLGYSIAKSGYRQNERRDDVLYGVVVFGLFGYVAFDLLREYSQLFIIQAAGAAIASAAVAILWRKWLRRFWYKALHRMRISNEDDTADVWSSIIQQTDITYTQVVLYLKDGTTLECDDVMGFNDAPIPGFYTDNNGNFALYVTHKGHADKDDTVERQGVRNEHWGDRLTIVPKDTIARVELRVRKL